MQRSPRKLIYGIIGGVVGLSMLASVACRPISGYEGRDTELQQAIAKADKDNDGVLQVTETSQFLRDMGYKGRLVEGDRFYFAVTEEGDLGVERIFGTYEGTKISIPRLKLQGYLGKIKR